MGAMSRFSNWRRASRCGSISILLCIGLLTLANCASQKTMTGNGSPTPGDTSGNTKDGSDRAQKDPKQDIPAPGLGYLEARKHLLEPTAILGGPIQMRISQDTGIIHVALPDYRTLDPRVFGDSAQPRALGGSPLIYGVPQSLRRYNDSSLAILSQPSAFATKTMIMRNGRMKLEAFDITATDAAVTRDSVRFFSVWQDSAGNRYSVRCKKLLPFGVQYPVFGGVVTNHILYGFSRIGTPLMPTVFAYMAFWGEGQVLKNDSIIDDGVMVHGMLTEFVRTAEYGLAFDHEVNPRIRQFHLMVLPYAEGDNRFENKPVNTGYELPNGSALPFWHVTFGNLDIRSRRLQDQVRAKEQEQFPQEAFRPAEKKAPKQTDSTATGPRDSASVPQDTAVVDTSSPQPQKQDTTNEAGELIPDDTPRSDEDGTSPETSADESGSTDSVSRDSAPLDSTDAAKDDDEKVRPDGAVEPDTASQDPSNKGRAASDTAAGDTVGVDTTGVDTAGVDSAPTKKLNRDSVATAQKESAVVVLMTEDLRFEPASVTIVAGQTVRWQNISDFVHTVTFDPRLAADKKNGLLPQKATPFNSGNIAPGETFQHTFTVPGNYTYFSIPHEDTGMIGTLEVREIEATE